MASLDDLRSYLDEELRIAEIPDYPGAVNGLQLEADGPIDKVAAAVDASLPVIEAAAASGAGLLLVHHGMFWQGVQPLRDAFYRKIRTAMDAGLAIYSAHLPLDIHPRWGNNACLGEALGIGVPEPFFDWKGIRLGLRAEVELDRASLHELLQQVVGGPVHLCPGGPETIRRLGWITGGAGSEIAAVAAEGIDSFVTGEGPHWSYPLAEELGVNLFYAGHYATETFGVRALATELGRRFELGVEFIDRPTGL